MTNACVMSSKLRDLQTYTGSKVKGFNLANQSKKFPVGDIASSSQVYALSLCLSFSVPYSQSFSHVHRPTRFMCLLERHVVIDPLWLSLLPLVIEHRQGWSGKAKQPPPPHLFTAGGWKVAKVMVGRSRPQRGYSRWNTENLFIFTHNSQEIDWFAMPGTVEPIQRATKCQPAYPAIAQKLNQVHIKGLAEIN